MMEILRKIPQTFFTMNDVKKFSRGISRKSLPVMLSRLVKQGVLQRILRGYFTFNLQQVDWEALVCRLRKPSYISLESALYHHGLISQIPETITLATHKKSKTYFCKGKTIEYAHIKMELFFGYEIQGNMLMAKKEKAILDELYFVSLKKRSFTIDPEWLNKINKKIFQKWLRMYPAATRKLWNRIVA